MRDARVLVWCVGFALRVEQQPVHVEDERGRRSRCDSFTPFFRRGPQPVLMLPHPVAVTPGQLYRAALPAGAMLAHQSAFHQQSMGLNQ